MRRLFTSESVTEGHPDKLCDQVSDAVLDAIIAQDPYARVACETFASTGMITVMGEITTSSYVDINAIVRKTVTDIGYDGPEKSFNGHTCAVMTAIHDQSPDIAMGVNDAFETRGGKDEKDIGAGDQGMMFGYACNETPEKMPLPIALSHRLALRLTKVRKDGTLPYLYPDGKTQVTVAYEDNQPVAVDTVVISAQHAADADQDKLRADIIEQVILPVIPHELITENTRIFVNPTGRFVIGGPAGGYRPDRPQDYCGYLRRLRTPRRRRLLRQGSHQSGPQRCLCRAARCPQRGCRRTGGTLPDSAGLRDRRG